MLKKLRTSLISVADDGLILPQSLRPACADQSAVDWLYKVLNGIFFAIELNCDVPANLPRFRRNFEKPHATRNP